MASLRFTYNGTDYPDPEILTIGDLFTKVKEKNKNGHCKNVLTNSAEHGLIPQKEFFEKDIAEEESIDKYTIIQNGDFVYNPRKSTTAPYGPFNCYKGLKPGVVSPLYSCMTPKNKLDTDYLLYYFESPAWYSYIYLNGNQGGARHDRVGMTDDLLKELPVLLPCPDERLKITKFLKKYDSRIECQKQKIKALETRKKGITYQIFNGDLRFRAKEGINFPLWDSIVVDESFDQISDKKHPDKTVLTIIQGNGTVPRDASGRNISYDKGTIDNYKLVQKNDFIMHLRSFEGGLEIATMEGIVSPAYTILRSKIDIVPDFYRYYFRSSNFINGKLARITEGIRDGRSINMDDFWILEIPYPSIEEQQKIADFLGLLDKQIHIEKEKLDAIKQVKKGLLQQMFI